MPFGPFNPSPMIFQNGLMPIVDIASMFDQIPSAPATSDEHQAQSECMSCILGVANFDLAATLIIGFGGALLGYASVRR